MWVIFPNKSRAGFEQKEGMACLYLLPFWTCNREWFTTILRYTFGSCSRFCFCALYIFFRTLVASMASRKGFCKRRQLGPCTYDVLHSKTTSYSSVQLRPKWIPLFVWFLVLVCFWTDHLCMSHCAFQTCHHILCRHCRVCATESSFDVFACEWVFLCVIVLPMLRAFAVTSCAINKRTPKEPSVFFSGQKVLRMIDWFHLLTEWSDWVN